MFILKTYTDPKSLLQFSHWSIAGTHARPNGQINVVMGLYKDAVTANDPACADNYVTTMDAAIQIDPAAFRSDIAMAIYGGLIAVPSEGQLAGFFSGCPVGE